MKLCAICNKNVATIFTAKLESGKPQIIGVCKECAQKMGLNMINDIMESSGITSDDMENYASEINDVLENVNISDIMNNNMFMNLFNNKHMNDDKNLKSEKDIEDDLSIKNYDLKKKGKKNINNIFNEKRKRRNLNKYGINLTDKANNKEVDPVIGRNREIGRVIQILNRRTKNNPILIGEPGVGKTAIAEGLAVKIINKEVPVKLFNVEVYLLDLTAVVAGTQFRGQFESRMKAIIEEVKSNTNIILVIDEVHNIIGVGETQGGSLNAANILKPALARGELQVIGATTIEEYKKYIEKDSALERRFQPVLINESTVQETIEILKGIKKYYEEYHKVKIPNDIIQETVKLTNRYITDRYFPDKAIDVIDEACSRANLKNKNLIKLNCLKEELSKLENDKLSAAKNGEYQIAATYKTQECKIREDMKQLEELSYNIELNINDVASVIEAWTNIPVQCIKKNEEESLLNLEKRLHKLVIGQEQGVCALSKAIRRNRVGFKRRRKPSSFIFVGPTGVGKTQLVKALAQELFGDENLIIRVDMSEYMEKHTVSKLIGSPPGYVGYEEGGQLTEKVRRKPYSIILLDEIEKAHPDVFNLLLQVLEDGRVTDSQGRTVYFDNTIIIMTSNAGTNFKGNRIGFGNENYELLECTVKDKLKEIFRPEFLNRVDEIIVFKYLTKEQQRKIIDLMLIEVKNELKEANIDIDVTSEVKDFILKIGYNSKYGARPLRRTIQKNIEDKIIDMYFSGEVKNDSTIKLILENDEIKIRNIKLLD